MSHVISSQPSSTSPYQPTEIQETSGQNPPRSSVTMETRQGQEDCCFRADKSQGCFLYYCCNFLSSICGGIRDCTESCCDCCADCLNECCEDKPKNKNQGNARRRRFSSGEYDDYQDDNTWVVGAIHHHNSDTDNVGEIYNSSSDHRFDDADNHKPTNISSGHDARGHHDSGDHQTTTYHSSSHQTSSHHSNDHHSSSHDTGHHTSCHDSGGNHDTGGDSGWGCDSGGGDDSGGGGCDSGGGGCDSGGGDD